MSWFVPLLFRYPFTGGREQRRDGLAVLLSGANSGEIVEEGPLLLLTAPARGYPGDR